MKSGSVRLRLRKITASTGKTVKKIVWRANKTVNRISSPITRTERVLEKRTKTKFFRATTRSRGKTGDRLVRAPDSRLPVKLIRSNRADSIDRSSSGHNVSLVFSGSRSIQKAGSHSDGVSWSRAAHNAQVGGLIKSGPGTSIDETGQGIRVERDIEQGGDGAGATFGPRDSHNDRGLPKTGPKGEKQFPNGTAQRPSGQNGGTSSQFGPHRSSSQQGMPKAGPKDEKQFPNRDRKFTDNRTGVSGTFGPYNSDKVVGKKKDNGAGGAQGSAGSQGSSGSRSNTNGKGGSSKQSSKNSSGKNNSGSSSSSSSDKPGGSSKPGKADKPAKSDGGGGAKKLAGEASSGGFRNAAPHLVDDAGPVHLQRRRHDPNSDCPPGSTGGPDSVISPTSEGAACGRRRQVSGRADTATGGSGGIHVERDRNQTGPAVDWVVDPSRFVPTGSRSTTSRDRFEELDHATDPSIH